MKRQSLMVFGLPFLVLALHGPTGAALAPFKMIVTPSTLELGTFYGGARISVAGMASAGSKVVVAVRGSSVAEVFNKVGRVGPIWVSTGRVTISDAPTLLFVFSSAPLSTCLNRAAIDQDQLDLASLKQHIQIRTRAPDRERVADDFLALKAHQGTYRVTSGSVQLGALDQGKLPYRVDFEMPRSAPPGNYRVSVIECRNGVMSHRSDANLVVVEASFPALIARLARDQAPFYGIISVVIAMVAGFGIDFIASRVFQRRAALR